MAREKGMDEDIGSMDTTTLIQGITKGPVCPPASFTIYDEESSRWLVPPLINVVPKTNPLPHVPMPSGGVC